MYHKKTPLNYFDCIVVPLYTKPDYVKRKNNNIVLIMTKWHKKSRQIPHTSIMALIFKCFHFPIGLMSTQKYFFSNV